VLSSELEKFCNLVTRSDIYKLLEDNKIFFVIETILPAKDILKAMERFRKSRLGVCYDLGNAAAMGFVPEDEILELGNLIRHVHIKDREKGGPNVLLGKGSVDFFKGFQSLKKIDYNGLVILETAYFEKPIDEAKRNLGFITEIIRELNG
jgi:sugar phosphate isomerase/epimerase